MSAHNLPSGMSESKLVTKLTGTTPLSSIGHDITEIAFLRVLEARWQFFESVNDTPASDTPVNDTPVNDTPPDASAPTSHPPKPITNTYLVDEQNTPLAKARNDVMAYWHVSNARLEHTLELLAQQALEQHIIDLNDLIGSIVKVIYPHVHVGNHQLHLCNNNRGNKDNNRQIRIGVFGVDVGIATTLPSVVAPPLLLHWVFSELLITSWLNSLPATFHQTHAQDALHIPLTDVATVVINCLDADDAWHITISSDQHHADVTTASLTQLKTALQHFGGDVYAACDDEALLQTVVLPKSSYPSH